MSSLHFNYGSMNSGKSTMLIQTAHNYTRNDQRVMILKPHVDTKSPYVLSRIGAKAPVDLHVEPYMNLLEEIDKFIVASPLQLACVLVDEAQFLHPDQVDQLLAVTVRFKIPVLAYGLRTDFHTHAFPGAARLLQLAHHLNEIKTVCACGKKATLVGRQDGNGAWVKEGPQVVIDGDAVYIPLCSRCYDTYVGLPV